MRTNFRCKDCNSIKLDLDAITREMFCTRCGCKEITSDEELLPCTLKAKKEVDDAWLEANRTIDIVIQRSRADTYKYGYRFRARSVNGYDYSFGELKVLSKKGHNFKFIFDDNVPEEQKNYAIDKYLKLGLDIINSGSLSVKEQLEMDLFMYGVSYYKVVDGNKIRLDPTEIVMTKAEGTNR